MQKNQKQIKISRRLRSKQTDAEKLLWSKMRNRQLYGKFRRQHSLGPYIVDFINLESKLIIEIDGGHHDEKEVREKDTRRTTWLRSNGYKVLRFWDNDVLNNISGVLEEIVRNIKEIGAPSP